MKLKHKTWLWLGMVLGGFLVVDLVVSFQGLQAESRDELEHDAKTLYGFMMATRRVYQEQFVASGLPVEDHTIGFLPAHSFLRISRDFANWNDSGILFNNVSDRPRNPANRADRFELEAIDWFRRHPAANERLTDIVSADGIGYLMFTAPIRIEAFCLKCHGEPSDAPPSIQVRYADAYDYQVGDLRGLVSIRIPTAAFEERIWRLWGGQLLQSLLVYSAAFLVLGWILDHLVIHRLSCLRDAARQIASGDYSGRVIRPGRQVTADGASDEIDSLALTFDRMAESIEMRDQTLLKLSQAVEQSPTSIVITDLDMRIEYVNAAFIRTTGYQREELLGKTPRILQSGRTPPETHRALWQALIEGRSWQGEFINRRKDGSDFVESAVIAPVRGADGEISHYLAVKQDITEQRNAESEIHRLAFFDSLTGLPNRRLMLDRLDRALAASQRSGVYGALLMLDLDNFKALNDTRGHDAGDLLLQEVARRLVACVRGSDTVARLGGDEYVVILENLGESEVIAAHQAEGIGEKVRAEIGRPYDLDHVGSQRAGASIGITLFSGSGHSSEGLLKQADVALYQAKGAGRNNVRFFNIAMQQAIDARMEMESALREALDNQELQLNFQPQVDERGVTVGAEVLLRWSRAGGERVSPAQFIPLAEDTGLIIPIGEWVVRAACAQLKSWSGDPRTRDLQLAINVSARQFHHRDFAPRLAACLAESGVEASKLKLELTESVVLDNVSEVIEGMYRLKALGLRFSLDDFGTGYSSLSYLKRLPLDEIKIDQSFVRDIADDPNDAAIVRAILAISQSLDLRVVAEGVETEAQHDFLRSNGCVAFQGYLFGRPMSIEEWSAHYALGPQDQASLR